MVGKDISSAIEISSKSNVTGLDSFNIFRSFSIRSKVAISLLEFGEDPI